MSFDELLVEIGQLQGGYLEDVAGVPVLRYPPQVPEPLFPDRERGPITAVAERALGWFFPTTLWPHAAAAIGVSIAVAELVVRAADGDPGPVRDALLALLGGQVRAA